MFTSLNLELFFYIAYSILLTALSLQENLKLHTCVIFISSYLAELDRLP